MKSYHGLHPELVRHPERVVDVDAHRELPCAELLPGVPPCVAISVERVPAVTLARPNVTLPLRHGIHGAQADQRLVAAIFPSLRRNLANQRTERAAVRL